MLADDGSETLLAKVFNAVGRNENPAWFKSTLTKIRRARDCGEDIAGFSTQDVEIVERYISLLRRSSKVDFDEIVSLALRIVRQNVWVCELLSSRFRWLLIDEYQDLGGPLHAIVTTLIDKTDLTIFAVGDPDQTIYDFTGAHPKYLAALSERADFRAIRLRFNYRSGRRLIVASQAALAPPEPREYEPDPNREDEGEVFFYEAQPELESHAELITTEIIPELRTRGLAFEEIAILYRQKGVLTTAIQAASTTAAIPFIAEKDSDYPRAILIRWLQECASRAIDENAEVLFENLVRFYHQLCYAAGEIESSPNLEIRIRLYDAVTSFNKPDERLGDWLAQMDAALHFQEMLSGLPEYMDDLSSLQELLAASRPGDRLTDHSVSDFAIDAKLRGKVVLTTLHSSKGRQFDAVILPGLVEGLLPTRRWDRKTRTYMEPSSAALSEDRRLFYVGFTRARKSVAMVSADSYINAYGYRVKLGESRFVTEIRVDALSTMGCGTSLPLSHARFCFNMGCRRSTLRNEWGRFRALRRVNSLRHCDESQHGNLCRDCHCRSGDLRLFRKALSVR